jgi:hypothetical protein
MRSFMICIPHPIFADDKIENNEMGGAFSAWGRWKRFVQGFGGET